MDVLVTYDVNTTTRAGERRLTRVAHACEAYGIRVQKSVFECRLSSSALERLLVQLETLIDRRADSVNVYFFEGVLQDKRLSIGRAPLRQPGDTWII